MKTRLHDCSRIGAKLSLSAVVAVTLALVSVQPAAAQFKAQSGGNAGLCLGVMGGSLKAGQQLIMTPCAADGTPAQTFDTIHQSGGFRFSTAGYCLQVPVSVGAGTLIAVAQCRYESNGKPAANQYFSPGMYSNLTLGHYCISMPGVTGGVVFLDYCRPGLASQTWSLRRVNAIPTNVVVAPQAPSTLPSLALTPGIIGHNASALLPLTGIDSQGRLLGPNRTPISSAGGFYFITGVIAAGAGNVIAAGAGNVIAAGAGNYSATLGGISIRLASTNGGNLTGLLVDNRGNPVRVVASGGGNYQIVAGGQVIAAGAGNVIAAGAGNVIAAGAGNVIAAGAGNLQIVAPSSAVSVARLIGSDGAALLAIDGSQFLNSSAMARMMTSSASLVGPGGSSYNPGAINPNMLNLRTTVAAYQGTTSPAPGPFQITGISSNANANSWPVSNPLPVSWTTSGTPRPYQTVSIWLQLSGSSTPMSLLPAINVAPNSTGGSASVPAPRGLSHTTSGVLLLRDDSTNQYRQLPVTLVVPQAAQAPAATPFQIARFMSSSNPSAWPVANSLPVSWTTSGTPRPYQTVSIWLQLSGSSTPISLLSAINVAPNSTGGSASVLAPRGLSRTTSGVLMLRDDSTNQYRQMPVTLIVPQAAQAPASGPFQITGFSSSANANSWPVSNPLPVSWTTSGTPRPYQTVSIWLQLAGSNTPISLATTISVASGSSGGSMYVPAPRGLSQTTSGVLMLRDDITNQYRQMPVTLVVPQAAAVTQQSSAPQAAPGQVAVSSFAPDSTTWPNKTPLVVRWNYTGNAPGNQIVLVQLQADGKTWDLGTATWVGYKVYQTPTYDWITILHNSTSAAIVLLDGQSRRPLSNPVPITIRIP